MSCVEKVISSAVRVNRSGSFSQLENLSFHSQERGFALWKSGIIQGTGASFGHGCLSRSPSMGRGAWCGLMCGRNATRYSTGSLKQVAMITATVARIRWVFAHSRPCRLVSRVLYRE